MSSNDLGLKLIDKFKKDLGVEKVSVEWLTPLIDEIEMESDFGYEIRDLIFDAGDDEIYVDEKTIKELLNLKLTSYQDFSLEDQGSYNIGFTVEHKIFNNLQLEVFGTFGEEKLYLRIFSSNVDALERFILEYGNQRMNTFMEKSKPIFRLKDLENLMSNLREYKGKDGKLVFGDGWWFNHLYSNCCNTCGWEDYYPKGKALETNTIFVTKIFEGGMNDSLDEDGNWKGHDINVSHQNFTKEKFKLLRSKVEELGWRLTWPEYDERKCMILDRVKSK